MAAAGSAPQSAGGIRGPRSLDETGMQILRTLTAEAIHRIGFRQVTGAVSSRRHKRQGSHGLFGA
jgi:hypothetical protein